MNNANINCRSLILSNVLWKEKKENGKTHTQKKNIQIKLKNELQ